MTPGPVAESILPLEFDSVGYAVGGRALLRELSFRLEPGLRTLILGPNGAGKSLTLRLAHGLIRPSAGSVRWHGVAPERDRRRQVMVFERPVLLRRSVLANMEYALALQSVPRRTRRGVALEFLRKTGLEALAHRAARVLSAGEQQRLAIARAWATEPEVLLLDDPTAALDPGAARSVEELIGAVAGSGTRIVMTTHDLAQARRLADEVLFFDRGRLLEHARADVFFDRPGSDRARAFLRGEPMW